ncbi:hypothetical protein PYCC9005_002475 [Savitreella phatthalungensis]
MNVVEQATESIHPAALSASSAPIAGYKAEAFSTESCRVPEMSAGSDCEVVTINISARDVRKRKNAVLPRIRSNQPKLKDMFSGRSGTDLGTNLGRYAQSSGQQMLNADSLARGRRPQRHLRTKKAKILNITERALQAFEASKAASSINDAYCSGEVNCHARSGQRRAVSLGRDQCVQRASPTLGSHHELGQSARIYRPDRLDTTVCKGLLSPRTVGRSISAQGIRFDSLSRIRQSSRPHILGMSSLHGTYKGLFQAASRGPDGQVTDGKDLSDSMIGGPAGKELPTCPQVPSMDQEPVNNSAKTRRHTTTDHHFRSEIDMQPTDSPGRARSAVSSDEDSFVPLYSQQYLCDLVGSPPKSGNINQGAEAQTLDFPVQLSERKETRHEIIDLRAQSTGAILPQILAPKISGPRLAHRSPSLAIDAIEIASQSGDEDDRPLHHLTCPRPLPGRSSGPKDMTRVISIPDSDEEPVELAPPSQIPQRKAHGPDRQLFTEQSTLVSHGFRHQKAQNPCYYHSKASSDTTKKDEPVVALCDSKESVLENPVDLTEGSPLIHNSEVVTPCVTSPLQTVSLKEMGLPSRGLRACRAEKEAHREQEKALKTAMRIRIRDEWRLAKDREKQTKTQARIDAKDQAVRDRQVRKSSLADGLDNLFQTDFVVREGWFRRIIMYEPIILEDFVADMNLKHPYLSLQLDEAREYFDRKGVCCAFRTTRQGRQRRQL